MASKFCLASGIPERRIRPIWDAVDSRQYKAALKLSIALLTKYPKSPYAIALKALILERLGKTEEALSVCLHAKERLYSDDVVYIDDLTLSTLHIVFQRLNRLDLGTSCYEYACGKFPNNLELMIGLFNCYVREYSFVKQQQTAIKMYKIASEERFLLWSVCSIQLQVLCGNGGEKLLLLAEGLLKKHVGSHSLHEPEALLVYVSVLEQQAKYGAALEILSEKLGSLLVIEVDKLRIEGRLLARACDYAAAAEIFKRVLELCPDDWECFLDYLACLLEDDSRWSGGTVVDEIHPPKFVTCKLSHLTHEVFDSRISEASQFVQNLQTEDRNDFTRCPYLATLEIERRKRLFGKIGDAKLMDGLVDYFCRRGKLEVIDAGWLQLIKVCLCGYIAELHSHGRWSIVINIRNHNCRFGQLACFTTDVEAFLQVLTHDEKMEIVGKFVKSCGSLSTAPLKVLGQSITIFKIQELFGSTLKMPLEELERTAVSMAEMYCKNLPLSKDLDLQENMHGEDLLCMASNLLVQLFWRTRHLGYLLEAILVLEFGLTIRRHISQYKISLLHLYSHLSALPLAHERYKTLEVKNILLETISHHILPQMMVSPLWSDLSDLLKDYLKFMDDYSKESADLTFLAYRHRNYSKVIEFVQFKERLENSHQYLMSRLETAILQLKQKSDDIEEEECILESLDSGIQLLELSSVVKSKSLTFNEDTESRPWWTPTPDKNYLLGPFEVELLRSDDDLQKQTKEREVKVIERRSLVPRMIYLCIQCASSSIKESSEANGSTLGGKNSLELKSLLERYATTLGLCLDDAVETIVGVSTSQQSFEVFGSEIIDWMNLAVFVDARKLGSNPISSSGQDEHVSGSWSIVNSLIEKYTVWKLGSMQPLIQSPGSDLHLLVQLVSETMAWQSLVLQSCIRSSFPSGRKKRKIGPTDQLYPLFQSIQNSIQAMYGSLVEISKWLKEQMDKPEDEYLDLLSSNLHKEGPNHGPGQVLHVLESLASSSGEVELGDRIFQSLSSWNSADLLRKTVVGQRKVISEFHIICESKLKLLQKLKHQI